MNITTFFYCDCGFEKALNEGEDFVIVQCGRCLSLASATKKFTYHIVCSACEHHKEIGDEVEFEKEEICENCSLKGTIGLKDVHLEALFHLENHVVYDGKCERCRENNWIDPEKTNFKCPSCFKNIKQKMSNVWEK